MTEQRRMLTFGVLVGCALVAAVVAVVLAAGSKTPTVAEAGHAVPVSQALVSAPHIVFRDTERGAGYGRVGIVPLANPNARPAITGLDLRSRLRRRRPRAVPARRPRGGHDLQGHHLRRQDLP